MKQPELVDSSITPDPWKPATGDVYNRPTSLGWESVVVLSVQAATLRPALHDLNESVEEPEMVRFLDSAKGSALFKTSEEFRSWLVCFNLRAAGRVRKSKPLANPHGYGGDI